MFQTHETATTATTAATGNRMTETARVFGIAQRARMINPHRNATSPKGWYCNDDDRSKRRTDRADRVIPHNGHGTPVIVNSGHGGIGENGRTSPTAASPRHPTTSHRNGPRGTAIIAARRDRLDAQSEECTCSAEWECSADIINSGSGLLTDDQRNVALGPCLVIVIGRPRCRCDRPVLRLFLSRRDSGDKLVNVGSVLHRH